MGADFDRIASSYDKWYDTPLGKYAHELEKELILQFAAPKKGERILDVGCGTGIYAIELAKMGLDVTCYDRSRNMLRVSWNKAQERRIHMNFVLGTAEKLPFRDRSFDLIISITTLEFIEHPALVVNEMKRVLRRSGRIVLGVLNSWSSWAIERKLKSLVRESVFKYARFYNPLELTTMLRPMKVEWDSTLLLPPETPEFVLNGGKKIEKFLVKILKPFGAFICLKATWRGR